MTTSTPPTNLSDPNQLSSFLQGFTHLLDILAVLASPKLLARLSRLPPSDHIRGLLNHYIAAAPHMQPAFGEDALQSALPQAQALYALFQDATITAPAPPEMVQAARAFFEAAGMGTPPCGWDDFEGLEEDESPQARQPARPPPSPFIQPERVWTSWLGPNAKPIPTNEPSGAQKIQNALLALLTPDLKDRPDGYWISADMVIHTVIQGEHYSVKPWLVGWKRDRISPAWNENSELPAPDWVLDGLGKECVWSPSDRLTIYAGGGIAYLWYWNSKEATLTVMSPDAPRGDASWSVHARFDRTTPVKAPPFEHTVLNMDLAQSTDTMSPSLQAIEEDIARKRADLDAWLAETYAGRESERYSGELDASYAQWTAIETLAGSVFDQERLQHLSPAAIDSMLFFISRSDECGRIIAWLTLKKGSPLSHCGKLRHPDFLFLCEQALQRKDDDCDYQLVTCFQKCESLDEQAVGLLQRFFHKQASYTRRMVLHVFEHFAHPQAIPLAVHLWESDDCEFAKLSCLYALKKFPEAKEQFELYLQEYQNAYDVEAEEYRRTHMRRLRE